VIPPLANVLQPLINAAEAAMVFFHDHLGFGWGMAIVALTFLTRLIILPLTIRQLRSMRALQVLQPQIKEIQKKYKDDRPRLQQEMMKFYKEHEVNPFSSCMPLLLQLPVFITLFYTLRHDLKPHLMETAAHGGNDGWLFIPNLGEKATGGVLVALVILYIGTQLMASAVTAVSADSTQRTLMFALPFIFVPFILNFPSGLVVYWIATNAWTFGQQVAVRRWMPAPPIPTPEEARAAKPPPLPPRKKKRRA
jgi:YidC/Oxa1 family membrane protein insertase